MTPSLFEQVGGLPGLRVVITTFYDIVFDDVMIGYLFWNADKARLIDKEVELAARMLGASHVPYTGQTMRGAHSPHRILSGQFDRRLQILREAMAAHDTPQSVQDAWVEHSEALRAQIIQAAC